MADPTRLAVMGARRHRTARHRARRHGSRAMATVNASRTITAVGATRAVGARRARALEGARRGGRDARGRARGRAGDDAGDDARTRGRRAVRGTGRREGGGSVVVVETTSRTRIEARALGNGTRAGDSQTDEDAVATTATAKGRRRRMSPKEALRLALADLDASGWWAVISSGIVFGTFLLETYNVSSLGGWDILYREDIPWYTGIISMDSLISIEDAYNLLFLFELCLRAYAADFSPKFWLKPVTVVDVVSTVPPLLAIFDVLGRSSPVYRFLRLLRVLRLLRLLDRSTDSVLFGLVKSDSMGVQLIGIGSEFVCIFVIAAGVIYDLEYGVNPMVHNLNDTLYWAILTLTGIGQPFEVVTAGGRVATVISIVVALIVVPGQLAKLAAISGAQDLMKMMDDDDDQDVDGFVRLSSSGEEGASSQSRRTVFDDRECQQCGLTMHERDARFCRRCAARLDDPAKTDASYVRSANRQRARAPAQSFNLPGMRLGIDTTSSVSNSAKEIQRRARRE